MQLKVFAMALLCTGLTGCFDDTSEQQEFMNQVRAKTRTVVKPLPEIKKFEHFQYSASSLKSPFVATTPDIVNDGRAKKEGCISPIRRLKKETLEGFPTDTLTMKGTLRSPSKQWGLILASDGSLHRVVIGSYVGLYHGKVTKITRDMIELLEMLPDGNGCWKERITELKMKEAKNAS